MLFPLFKAFQWCPICPGDDGGTSVWSVGLLLVLPPPAFHPHMPCPSSLCALFYTFIELT